MHVVCVVFKEGRKETKEGRKEGDEKKGRKETKRKEGRRQKRQRPKVESWGDKG